MEKEVPTTNADTTPEKVRLAQRLHDTVCQELTGIGFLAAAAAHQNHRGNPRVEQQFQEIADLIQRAGAQLAEIVHELRAGD